MSRDLTLLHPKLQQIIPQIIGRASELGLPVLVTDGFRTQAEQDAIYAQGRTRPGTIVSNARWPYSAHNWGVAIDFCRNVRGREYDDSDGFFRRVAAVAKGYGLEWGGDWKNFVDKPHLQLSEFMPGNSTTWLIRTYGTPERFRRTWREEDELDMTKDELLSVKGTGDKPSNWAKDATEWAKATGVFAGDGNGNYGWQVPITREQLAQVLYNYTRSIKF